MCVRVCVTRMCVCVCAHTHVCVCVCVCLCVYMFVCVRVGWRMGLRIGGWHLGLHVSQGCHLRGRDGRVLTMNSARAAFSRSSAILRRSLRWGVVFGGLSRSGRVGAARGPRGALQGESSRYRIFWDPKVAAVGACRAWPGIGDRRDIGDRRSAISFANQRSVESQ